MSARSFPSHAWWSSNYPPNGHGCRCFVESYDQATLDRRGWQVDDEAPSYQAPEGFGTSPARQASADERLTELQRQASKDSVLAGYTPPKNVVVGKGADGPVVVAQKEK